MLKAVLDTNVIVSGAITDSGAPFEVLKRWRNGEFVLVMSEAILEEIDRVLHYPKIKRKRHLTEKNIRDVVERLRKYSVNTPGEISLAAVIDDPSDNKFLAAAVEAEADCIVSGDRHLKALSSYQEIRIISPGEFIQMLDSEGREQ